MYRVIIAKAAKARVREQARYIAVEAQDPVNAERWLSRVLAAAASLGEIPRRCPKAIESGFRPYEIRVLDVEGYLLLFTVHDEDQAVRVLSARHGRQLPRAAELPPDMPEASGDRDD